MRLSDALIAVWNDEHMSDGDDFLRWAHHAIDLEGNQRTERDRENERLRVAVARGLKQPAWRKCKAPELYEFCMYLYESMSQKAEGGHE